MNAPPSRSTPPGSPAESPAPITADQLRDAIVQKLIYSVGKDRRHARDHDWFVATALATRDQIVERWMEATRRTYRDGQKRVYYFSLEFLQPELRGRRPGLEFVQRRETLARVLQRVVHDRLQLDDVGVAGQPLRFGFGR